MSHPTPQLASLTLIRRRRALTSTAAAALSLAGCNMLGQPAAAPLSPEQIEAERQVKAYQSDIETALDKVDRERLRAAAERKNGGPVVVSPTATAPAQVILASTGAESLTVSDAASVGRGTLAPPGAPTVSVSPIITTSEPVSPAPVVVPQPATPISPTPTPAAAVRATPAPTPPTPAAPVPAAPVASNSAPVPALNPPTSMGVVVSPLVGDTSVPSAIIAPFTPPNTSTASAMGAMTAMVNSAQVGANDPAVAPTVPAESSITDALDVLRKNIDAHPSLNTVLALALLDNAHGTEALKKLPDADQKVVSDLLGALEAMKAKPPAATLAERAAPILDASKHWQEDADLALPRLVLATRVDSYGVFTPVASSFEQGKRHTVIIYCEVANFASKKGDDGWYTTKLAQQETLFTEDGLLVWRPNAEDVEDRSLNQRHDFYLVKKLTIPETLAAGKYTLRMSVTDRNTNKIKIIEMPIEITLK